jgi:chromosome partitioning protein
MMKVFAITNQKGGVGKTTSTVNIAAGLAALNQRVLVVDLDPQGNATTGSGVNKEELSASVYHLLIEEERALRIVQKSLSGGYDLWPANRELAGAEVELVEAPEREYRLKKGLAQVSEAYDWVLIDCPPALNLLTINALTASWRIIIPMQCEYYALEGLSDLVQTVKRVRQHLNPALEIEGLIRTMVDQRNALSLQVSAQLEQHFGNKVYRTAIPRNVRLAEAPSHGQTILQYDRSSKGAQAYWNLAQEILQRLTQ